MSSDWSHLPLSPLKLILQQLPLKQRMQSCALVSTSWADAAIAATVDLASEQLELDSTRRAKACHSWCVKHHAYAKNVSYSSMRVMGSPLNHSRLQALSISTTWTVRLAAAGQWRGLLQDATALTTLNLNNTSIYGWPEAAVQLTGLKSLAVSAVKSKDPGEPHVPGQHLGLLQQLTCLKLKDDDAVTAAALQQLSRLSKLQELCLAGADWADDEDDGMEWQLATVNSSIGRLQCLTSLDIFCCSPVPVGISKLTSLQQLRIDWGTSVHPECFAGGGNLRSLSIANSRMAGEGAQGQLLQHLERMKHLTFLDLSSSLTDYNDWEGVSLSAFGGITASSSLQYLNLEECCLAEGAWRSMFRQTGQQLTALGYLSLRGAAPGLAANDIKRMVQACPNLHTLNLRTVLQPKVSLLALTKLTRLTELDISRVTTESGVRILAQLSGLRELRVRQPSEVSRVSRLHLTALKQLREVVLPACRSDCADDDDDEWYWRCCNEEGFSNKVSIRCHEMVGL